MTAATLPKRKILTIARPVPDAPKKSKTPPQKAIAKRRDTQKGAGSFMPDPRKARDNEKIGGGFFIFRRGKGTSRIRAPEYPFEHPDMAAALEEMRRLKQQHPNESFELFCRIMDA